jgi:hypothetical protein
MLRHVDVHQINPPAVVANTVRRELQNQRRVAVLGSKFGRAPRLHNKPRPHDGQDRPRQLAAECAKRSPRFGPISTGQPVNAPCVAGSRYISNSVAAAAGNATDW